LWNNYLELERKVPYGISYFFSSSQGLREMIFTPFRYALQLLSPASILASLAGRNQLEPEDISEINELFLDAKASASLINTRD